MPPMELAAAGSRAGEADTRLARNPGVAVGHQRRGVLMAGADEANGVLVVVESVVDLHHVGGDYPEDGINTLGTQRLY